MELGGVGRPPVFGFAGADLAATEAKLSFPSQKSVLRGLGILTDSVIPARAREMLEGWVVLVGAIRSNAVAGLFLRAAGACESAIEARKCR